MSESNVIPFRAKPVITVTDYWGGCPLCGRNDGYLNVGPDHWYVCHQHRTKWWVASGVFSGWRDEPEEEHTRNYYRLCNYREVTPLLQEASQAELEAREIIPFEHEGETP